MITLNNVALVYQTPEGGIIALKDVSLSVPREKTLAVVGVSGSGKTTLLHVMAGLTRPTAGQICFDGANLTGPRREIAVVFQDYGLFPWKTIGENVGLPLRLRGDKREKERADALLARLGILEQRDKYPRQLSGGQRQRAAVGRAIISDPQVLLMDEPFSALDALTRRTLQQDMNRLCRERGLSCVLVTHSIEEALIMGDRVAVFAPGGQSIAGVIENEGHFREGFLTSTAFLHRSGQIRKMLEGVDEAELS